MGAYVWFSFAGFLGEGLQCSLVLHFLLKHIKTCIHKKYLIFQTLQFGLNKGVKNALQCSMCSAGVTRGSCVDSVVLFRSEDRKMW